MRPPRLGVRIAATAAMAIVGAVILFPLYAVLLISVSRAPGFSAVVSPDLHDLTLVHFVRFLGEHDAQGRWLFGRQLFNSLWVAGGATLLGVLFATTSAYAFSRLEFPGRKRALGLFVVTQMFPATMLVVPLYLVLDALGLVDTALGLMLVYATTALPFCVWMLKGAFDGIPQDLDEAALIDGASRLRVFYQVVLPLARPA